jgi:hypothetical protein
MNVFIHNILESGAFTLSRSISSYKNCSLSFDHRLKQLKFTHARILAAWAILNILSACIIPFFSYGKNSYILAMNASWGIINLGIAAFIYYHHNSIFDQPQTVLQQMDHQRHVESIIPFNIGLDLAFVATGFALFNYGHRVLINYSELWIGFGISIIVQGCFLLIQDSTFYMLHIKNRKNIYPHWKKRLEKL